VSARELTVLIIMCLIWGFHFVVIKLAVTEIPPIFYAAIRMTLVAVMMAAFLRWRPGHMVRVLSAGICLGALNYVMMFTGIKYATASTAAIALELYVPFVTILAIFFLNDRLGWRRGLGIAVAFAGVAVIALGKPAEAGPDTKIALGVGLVAVGAFLEAVGAVLVKQAIGFKPHELLAWFAVVGAPVLWIMTALFENDQAAAFAASDKQLIIGAVLYSAIASSVVGHTAYYWLIQRLPMTVVAPSALLTTMLAVFFGVVLLGEPFGPSMIIGGLMTLAGVGFVLLRSAAKHDINAPVTEPSA